MGSSKTATTTRKRNIFTWFAAGIVFIFRAIVTSCAGDIGNAQSDPHSLDKQEEEEEEEEEWW